MRLIFMYIHIFFNFSRGLIRGLNFEIAICKWVFSKAISIKL